MIRLQPWTVDGHTISPLTVRQRIALTEALADEYAKRAAEDCKLIGMPNSERVKVLNDARERAHLASTLIGECFTLAGSMRILAVACKTADALVASMEPKDLTVQALMAIGIDTDRIASEEEQGNG